MEALRTGKKKLPKGWRWEKLKTLGKLSQGGTPSTDIPDFLGGSIPFITGADVTNLYVSKGRSHLSERGFESGKTQQCNAGDLLIVSRTRVGSAPRGRSLKFSLYVQSGTLLRTLHWIFQLLQPNRFLGWGH